MSERRRRRAHDSHAEVLGTATRTTSFTWPKPGEDMSDLPLIEASARELDAEAEDALSYQLGEAARVERTDVG